MQRPPPSLAELPEIEHSVTVTASPVLITPPPAPLDEFPSIVQSDSEAVLSLHTPPPDPYALLSVIAQP